MGGAQTTGEMIQKIGVDDKGLLDSFKRQEKGYKRTTDTVKKSGDAMQKTNANTGKSFDKLGNAGYDFGSQIFSATTVMEAMKEGTAGVVEQLLMGAMGTVQDFQEWQKQFDEHLHDAIESGDYRDLADFLKTSMFGGAEIFPDKEMTTTSLSLFESNLKTAIEKQDWSTVNTLISKEISSGDMSGVDAAIIQAVGKGDYTAAVKLIDTNMAEHGDFEATRWALDDALSGAAEGVAAKMTALFPDALATMKKITIGEDSIEQYVKDFGAAHIEDTIAENVNSGLITGAEGAALENYISLEEMHTKMVRDLQDCAAQFGQAIKDPKNLAGLGDAIYNLVEAEINDRLPR